MNDITKTEVLVPEPQTVTPMMMLQTAVEKGTDISQLQQLMELQERWERTEAKKAYHRAFSAFKAEAVEIIKRVDITDGPLKGKKYADLPAAVDAATPALSRHGLSASWKITKNEKDWIEVECTLTHIAGHSESTAFGGPPDTGGAKNAMQARSSTLNYCERYSFLAVTGLAAKGADNDGAGGKREAVEPDAEGKKALEACGSMAALSKAWAALTPEQRKTLATVKEDCKTRISEADKATA